MLIKGSSEYNYKYNSEITEQPPFGQMINGQGEGAVSKLRYGVCFMSFNGCEVIAVHNALVYLKKPQKIRDVAFYMERFRVLMGFFGCNAYSLGKALNYFDAQFERVKSPDDAKAFIVTFWTKAPFLSSIHTVFCTRENSGGIRVYNRYNSCTYAPVCDKLEDIIGNRRPIAVYKIV